MKIGRRGTTIKQMAYAKRVLGGQGQTKGEIALNSGYSANVSRSVKSHIEDKVGFHNAMSQLAVESNNLALAAMHEFKARGFEAFTNKELIGALNAIGNAWSKFNDVPKDKNPDQGNNKLRMVVLQQIENQVNQSVIPMTPSSTVVDDKHTVEDGVVNVTEDLDF